MVDAQDLPILQFTYADDWYPETDGQGYSLTIIDPYLQTDIWGLKQSWRGSGVMNGTPGKPDVLPEPMNQLLVAAAGLLLALTRNTFRGRNKNVEM